MGRVVGGVLGVIRTYCVPEVGTVLEGGLHGLDGLFVGDFAG